VVRIAMTDNPPIKPIIASLSESSERLLFRLGKVRTSASLVERHVNRLKLIKRFMYGRANFDLLRLRVVNAA